MKRKPIMRDERTSMAERTAQAGYRFVIITLDAHAAGPAARIAPRLQKDFPGIVVAVHAAAEWAENPAALARAKADVAAANLVVANLLFIEEHITAILPDLQADEDGRSGHGKTRVGCHGAAEEAAGGQGAVGLVG
jgi:magnesium chelatase subunit H